MAVNRFAGTFNALDFAYGAAGGTGAPPIQVIAGSNSTGTYTLTCFPQTVYTNGGLAIPISAATPINVGSDSGMDINITPTTVSNNTLNQVLITAAFTYAHAAGAQISSATYGLQEALLAASKYGGGIVSVDAKWFASGGTQAMIEAATQYADVTIQDNGGSAGQSDPQTATVTLTNAQVLGMEAAPVQLLPPTDTNSFYQITQATLVNLNTGVAYANGGAITIGWGTTTATTQALSGTIAATFLTTPTSAYTISLAGVETASSALSGYLAKGIWITNATAPFITGTGTLQITLQYIKIYT